MVSQTFEKRDPQALKNHLLSIQVYGQKRPSDEFLASVEERGIIEPLVILPDGTVISGHTRKFAAFIKGLKEVPCIVRHDLVDQPLVVERMVIESNSQRVKTGDQLAREAAALAVIEEKSAALRQEKSRPDKGEKVGERKVVATLPPPTKPEENAQKPSKTRESVANSLGVSPRTAQKAINVGKAIEKAEKSGDTATVEKLTETARDKSLTAAAKMVEPKKPSSSVRQQLDEDSKTIERESAALKGLFETADKRLGVLFNAVDKKKGSCPDFAKHRHKKFEKLLRDLGDAIGDAQTHAGSVVVCWSDTKLQGHL